MRMDLAALGLSPEQERLYRILVTRGPHRAGELAEQTGVTDREAAAVLVALHEGGLVTLDSGLYRAAPPELALRGLLVRRRDELSRAETVLAELADAFQSGQGSEAVRTLAEVVVGQEDVRQRFVQLQHAATRRVRAFVKPEHTVMAAEENTAEQDAVQRGVSYEVVLERSMLERPGMLEQVRASVEAGESVRATEVLPLRMVIADDDMALVPVAADGTQGAVVVRRSGLLDALVALFEQTWEQSRDVVVPLGDGEELDGQIVALLLQGYGDTSIAHQLDVSPRTVQRRVRALMDRSGSSSRVQLGYWLGRRTVTGR